MDPNLRDQIQLLKDEFILFKMELVSKTETQFLNVKSQIAQMMEEISHQSETIQAVKSNVSALQLYLNENGLERHNFQPPLVNSQKGLNLRDKITVSEVNTSTLDETMKGKELQKENKVSATEFLNFSKTQEKENLIQNYRLEEISKSKQKIQPWSCESRIKSCCWTCSSKERLAKQLNKRTRNTFVKVKKMEKTLKECIKFSSTFVENVTQQLHDVNEKIDENSFDIEQCWKDMEDLRNTSKHIMINGDFVNVEDEISRMNFAFEALGLQVEEQNHKQLQLKEIQHIKTNQFEVTNRLMSERLQELERLRGNLILFLDSKAHELRTFPVQIAKGTKWKLDPVEIEDCTLSSQIINCKWQCLTAMEQYKNMSLEELRHLDYEGLDAPLSTLGLIKNAFKNALFPVPPTVNFSLNTNVRETPKTVQLDTALKFHQRRKNFPTRRRKKII